MEYLDFSKAREKVQEDRAKDREKRQIEFADAIEELKNNVLENILTVDEFAVFEKKLWCELMKLGLAICLLYLSWHRPIPEQRKVLGSNGKYFTYKGEKRYTLRSIFGTEQYTSSQYVRGIRRKANREICLLNSEVGLLPYGSVSPNIALEAMELSTRMPFDHVREVLSRFYGYVPAKRSILGLIDHLGGQAEAVERKQAFKGGNVIVIQADGRGLPCIRDEEMKKRCRPHKKTGKKAGKYRKRQKRSLDGDVRRTKGKKSKNKKQVTVGLIYSLNRNEDGGLEGPVDKRYIARFQNAEAVFRRLGEILAGLGNEPEQVIFISDGATNYPILQKKYFPQATRVLDFFHLCEYLWKAGSALFKEGSKQLADFVKIQKKEILEGNVAKVLKSLKFRFHQIPKKGPGNKGKRERLRTAINYIEKRLDLMSYKELREANLEIGSGAIESAVRQVVAIRFEGPGMRWGTKRPQKLLDLLCLRLSGGWTALEKKIRKWSKGVHEKTRMTPVGVNEKKKKESSHNTMKEKENLRLVSNG